MMNDAEALTGWTLRLLIEARQMAEKLLPEEDVAEERVVGDDGGLFGGVCETCGQAIDEPHKETCVHYISELFYRCGKLAGRLKRLRTREYESMQQDCFVLQAKLSTATSDAELLRQQVAILKQDVKDAKRAKAE